MGNEDRSACVARAMRAKMRSRRRRRSFATWCQYAVADCGRQLYLHCRQRIFCERARPAIWRPLRRRQVRQVRRPRVATARPTAVTAVLPFPGMIGPAATATTSPKITKQGYGFAQLSDGIVEDRVDHRKPRGELHLVVQRIHVVRGRCLAESDFGIAAEGNSHGHDADRLDVCRFDSPGRHQPQQGRSQGHDHGPGQVVHEVVRTIRTREPARLHRRAASGARAVCILAWCNMAGVTDAVWRSRTRSNRTCTCT